MSREGLQAISAFQPLEQTAWAPSTIANGTLFPRDQHRLKAYDLRRRQVD